MLQKPFPWCQHFCYHAVTSSYIYHKYFTIHPQKDENNVTEKSVKNKEQTKQKILDAVEKILADEGFSALGVNHIAREAGIGKTLIYRYFGGLEGLLEEYGATERFWPTVDEIRGMPKEEFEQLTMKERSQHIFHNFRLALKKRPHTMAIYAWEMVEKSDMANQFVAVRAQTSVMLVREMLGAKPVSPFDHEIVSLLGAGLIHLAIREHFGSKFAGIELDDEKSWERIYGGLHLIFDGLESLYEVNKKTRREKVKA